ncbi:MAG: arginine deiminase family protein [Candidatus Dormibacteria bacterium]|jgi:N-dimethylarginine dimethylaminohydrolase
MPILMCPPTHFGVIYEINPWMHVSSPVDSGRAALQWEALRDTYEELGVEVVLADPVPGLPDMVFTANAGVTRGDRVVLSRFRHPERQDEEPHWRLLFARRGMEVSDTGGVSFEGAGDALFLGDTLVCGHGFRTDRAAIALVASSLGVDVVELELIDPRYYHLDTCFCPLDRRTVLFAPAAFSPASRERVRRLAARVIEVPDGIAAGFACNAMPVGDVVISSTAIGGLAAPLRTAGYRVLGLPMGEFMKSGGGVRCLSLPVPEIRAAAGLPAG